MRLQTVINDCLEGRSHLDLRFSPGFHATVNLQHTDIYLGENNGFIHPQPRPSFNETYAEITIDDHVYVTATHDQHSLSITQVGSEPTREGHLNVATKTIPPNHEERLISPKQATSPVQALPVNTAAETIQDGLTILGVGPRTSTTQSYLPTSHKQTISVGYQLNSLIHNPEVQAILQGLSHATGDRYQALE